jgi:hypothetical protein
VCPSRRRGGARWWRGSGRAIPAKHYRGDDHDARHRSHKRPMHQLAAPLRRLSNAHSFNKCLLIQLVGKIASCPLIYRAITTSHLSGCPHRANRSIWLNHVQWE